VTMVARGADWSILDDGSDQGSSDIVAPSYDATNWKHPLFDDSGWQSGPAVLGFGDVGGATVSTTLEVGPVEMAHRTYYFRKVFNVADPTLVQSLAFEILRDDGAIVYLNGKEAVRTNMLAGPTGSRDLAEATIARDDESIYHQIALDPADLVNGANLLAVELHQATASSNDLGFDASLSAIATPPGAPTIPIMETTLVRTRARSSGGDWSAPKEAVYVIGTAAEAGNFVLSEMNYHPPNPTPAEALTDPTWNDDDFEWLELKNIGNETIDLSGAAFLGGIEFAFPLGTTLPAGEYVVLVENLAAFERRHGTGLPVAGVYANKLDNDGEAVRLVGIDGSDIFNFAFDDAWYSPTDGAGYTLVTADENGAPADANDPASWGISCQLLGTPGAPNGALSHTFEGWLNYHFTAAERADPLVSGFAADLDRDGIVTLMEFALGLDPRIPDSGALPAATVVTEGGENYLSLTFRRRKKALDLTYRAEVSPGLVSWTETSLVVGTPTDNGDGTETVTIRAALPLDLDAQGFIRLVVLKN